MMEATIGAKWLELLKELVRNGAQISLFQGYSSSGDGRGLQSPEACARAAPATRPGAAPPTSPRCSSH
jgi:hypothetical protein